MSASNNDNFKSKIVIGLASNLTSTLALANVYALFPLIFLAENNGGSCKESPRNFVSILPKIFSSSNGTS